MTKQIVRSLRIVQQGIKKGGVAYAVFKNGAGDQLKVHFPDRRAMEEMIGAKLATEFDISITAEQTHLG